MLSDNNQWGSGKLDGAVDGEDLNCLDHESKVPLRYSNPTFSSAVHESSQLESEIVSHSFRIGSFRSLKKLPTKIKAGEIQVDRLKTIMYNKHAMSKNNFKPPFANKYFEPLRYSSTDYGKLEQIISAENELKRLNLQSFSRKAFSYSSMRSKLKYEDIFEDKTYKYPVMGPNGDFQPIESSLRNDLYDTSKFAAGPFRATSNKGLIQRENVTKWCTSIHKTLAEDWPHLRFSIKYTKEEEIVIEFDISLIGDLDSLRRYMTQFSLNGLATEYHLRRRGDRWSVTEGTNVVFAMYVPWVAGKSMVAVRRMTERMATSKTKGSKGKKGSEEEGMHVFDGDNTSSEMNDLDADSYLMKSPHKATFNGSNRGNSDDHHRPSSRESNMSSTSDL